jgi:hypothetical protein
LQEQKDKRRDEYFLNADLRDLKDLRPDQLGRGKIGSTLKSGRNPAGGERQKERPAGIQ